MPLAPWVAFDLVRPGSSIRPSEAAKGAGELDLFRLVPELVNADADAEVEARRREVEWTFNGFRYCALGVRSGLPMGCCFDVLTG